MRLPNDVLQRVRGAMVVVTLAACGGEPAATPPSITPEPPVAMPAPIDPVAYDATSESLRLTRLDAEGEGMSEEREMRVSNVARAQRARVFRPGLGSFRGCIACGRG